MEQYLLVAVVGVVLSVPVWANPGRRHAGSAAHHAFSPAKRSARHGARSVPRAGSRAAQPGNRGSARAIKQPARPYQGSASSSTGSSSSRASSPPKTTSAKKKSSSKKRRTKREPMQKAPTPERILEIQSALARGGYFQGAPNGKWDANSVGAMQKFQSANGLSPSGKLDALSLQKLGLGSPIAGVSAPKPPPPACCSAGSASPATPALNPAVPATKPSDPSTNSASSAPPPAAANPKPPNP
jgi:Putative peptidoglycan binding domain